MKAKSATIQVSLSEWEQLNKDVENLRQRVDKLEAEIEAVKRTYNNRSTGDPSNNLGCVSQDRTA